MTVELDSPEVIAEIEALMARLGLSASEVVGRVILEAGAWMPMEALGAASSEGSKAQSSFKDDSLG